MRMSLEQLNDLLKRAVQSLHLDGLSMVTFEDAKPWLPEDYWRDQYDRARQHEADEAARIAADLFERSLVITRQKIERRKRDLDLQWASADDLMAEWDRDLPTLLGHNEELEREGWGRRTMRASGGMMKAPSDTQQPVYLFKCYQCGRPITERGANNWVDHSGHDHCDRLLMREGEGWDWHQPKPSDDEFEDEFEDDG